MLLWEQSYPALLLGKSFANLWKYLRRFYNFALHSESTNRSKISPDQFVEWTVSFLTHPSFLLGWSCMALYPSWKLWASLGEIFTLLTASSLGPSFRQQTQVGSAIKHSFQNQILLLNMYVLNVCIIHLIVPCYWIVSLFEGFLRSCHAVQYLCVLYSCVCFSPLYLSDSAGYLQWAQGRCGPVCFTLWGECPQWCCGHRPLFVSINYTLQKYTHTATICTFQELLVAFPRPILAVNSSPSIFLSLFLCQKCIQSSVEAHVRTLDLSPYHIN